MIQILIIAVLSLLAQFLLPWWSVAIVAFLVCFWRSERAGQSFFYGFYGIAIVWLVYAFILHSRTDGIFTGRMGELLFKTNNASLPVIVTAIIGGLVGGLAGLSGYFVKQAFGNQITNRTS
ncbi:hypothetical protein EXU85_01245 [Spirosoma sp. KCTC 42546]|uniref:hypothetical protein n=1 Tax=Spirosoma sp. KCTC 42546 TaxID=2520506 RepID=UPI0011579587|nr:hypothetical protein [Spirosoma sp. KCTC 42546]QDK77289.1 hypothetical protein EXU85_01245 [Spirosoma sp. KCTC 42546]